MPPVHERLRRSATQPHTLDEPRVRQQRHGTDRDPGGDIPIIVIVVFLTLPLPPNLAVAAAAIAQDFSGRKHPRASVRLKRNRLVGAFIGPYAS